MRAGKQPPVPLMLLPPSGLRLSHPPSGLRPNEENKRDNWVLDPARAENPGSLSVEDLLVVNSLLSGLPFVWQSWLWGSLWTALSSASSYLPALEPLLPYSGRSALWRETFRENKIIGL